MNKKVAIIQSSYIPWKGYFDIIGHVDQFVLYDCVQFTKRDWRNRNLIKTPSGTKWLTVPVKVKGRYDQLICNTEISDQTWAEKHWNLLYANYRKSPFYKEYAKYFEEIYSAPPIMLSELNRELIEAICRLIGIETSIVSSLDLNGVGSKTDRLLSICKTCNADVYVSGPSARGYLDVEKLNKNGIRVQWFNYDGYPEYHQLGDDFDHKVTILDLIFNCGPFASSKMKFGLR